MFSFLRKNKPASRNLTGIVADMHSHFLPGIDDGSPDMETSLELIRGMADLGYTKLITTPHVQWDIYKNTHDIIRTKEKEVNAAISAAGIPVEFRAAAEYFLDDHVDELLAADVPLLTLRDNLVLVEFSFIRQPPDLKEKIFQLQIKGYQPVIAHPERYLYFGANKAMYDEFRDMECLLQLNLLSLSGYYGKKQEELSQYLLRKNYVSLVGSDCHHPRHLGVLRSSSTVVDTVHRLLDEGVLLNPSF